MSISRNVYLVCGCPGDREELTGPLYDNSETNKDRDQQIWSDFESEFMFVSEGGDADMYGVMLGKVDAMHQDVGEVISELQIRKSAKTHRQTWVRGVRDFIGRNPMMSVELKKAIQTATKRAGDRPWHHRLFVEELG
jgi:hypothetical protein